MARAHREGMHYTYAQMVRTETEAKKQNNNIEPKELEDAVFQDDRVMSRIHRADMLRGRPDLLNPPVENNSIGKCRTHVRSYSAYGLSLISRFFHGLCELTSAPTGTAFKNLRNVASPMDETSTKNKGIMPGLLLAIGVAYTELFGAIKAAYTANFQEKAAIYGVGAMSHSAFVSSAAGLIAFIAGLASLMVMEKKPLVGTQRETLNHEKSQISTLLETFIRNIQTKNESTIDQFLSRALRSVKAPGQAKGSIPPLMHKLRSLSLDANKANNKVLIESTVGEYLSCSDINSDSPTFKMERLRRERELVKILNLFDHPEVTKAKFEGGSDTAKKILEERPYTGKDLKVEAEALGEQLHDVVLQSLSKVAKTVTSGKDNSVSKRLAKWGDPAHRARQAAKLKDPLNAARYRNRGDYMIANLHQYGPITRALVEISETFRFAAFNYLLATNVQSSRVFGASARGVQNTVSSGPASRSLCHSLGRFCGGALVAVIFSVVTGGFIADAGAPTSLDLGNGTVSYAQAGFMMAVFCAISLPVMLAAHIAARLEGWEGNIQEKVSKKNPALSL